MRKSFLSTVWMPLPVTGVCRTLRHWAFPVFFWSIPPASISCVHPIIPCRVCSPVAHTSLMYTRLQSLNSSPELNSSCLSLKVVRHWSISARPGLFLGFGRWEFSPLRVFFHVGDQCQVLVCVPGSCSTTEFCPQSMLRLKTTSMPLN